MLGALFILLALAAVAVVGAVCLFGVLAHLVIGLILLPFRIIGWLLWIPFMIVKGLVGAVFGLVVAVPFALLVAAAVIVGLVAVPLLPLVAIVAGIWLVARGSARPAAI
jgi:hypothetical protein